MTFGKFSTNPARHAFSKVAGEVDLCVDVRSQDHAVLDEVDALLEAHARRLAQATGTRIELGPGPARSPR